MVRSRASLEGRWTYPGSRFQHGKQLRPIERLCQNAVGSEMRRYRQVFERSQTAAAGYGKDLKRRPALPQGLNRFEALAPWHHDINDGYVRDKRLGSSLPFMAVRRLTNIVARGTQQGCDHLAHAGLVVDYQHSCHS